MLPDHGFIGAEPFLNGVAQALAPHRWRRGQASAARQRAASPWRCARGAARVPDGALSFLYLLHPDPWPKARHAKRRMMNDGPVDLFAAKLKPGGELRFGTDHPVYLRHALMVMRRHRASSSGCAIARPSSSRGPADGPRPATRQRPARSIITKSGTFATAALAVGNNICGHRLGEARSQRMGTLVYSLLMLGCADDGSVCQRLEFEGARYEASSQCQAQIPAALQATPR
jgi:hypothetical protein